MKKTFLELTRKLLSAPKEAGVLTPIVSEMAAILSSVTQISTEADMSNWQDVELASGVAISPVQAAKCLKESVRTQAFLNGVYKAISDKLEKHETVTVLYAGSGPYGTILIPLLPLFSARRVRVTIVDIHPENIEAIQKVTDWIGVNDYIDDYCILDACKWHPTGTTPSQFDMVLSETMNAFLKREPQVSIFAHLAQYLKPDGELIPQSIAVEAWLATSISGSDSDTMQMLTKTEKLTDLITLDRELADKIRFSQLTVIESQFQIPDYARYCDSVQLRTRITVYQEFDLGLRQSSLNAVMNIGQSAFQANSIVKCCYHISSEPDWEFDYKGHFDDLPLIEGNLEGNLGIKHLPRYWDKYRRLPYIQKLQLLEKEWEIEHKLLELLGVSHSESVAFIQTSHPELSEFEEWLRLQSNFPTRELINQFNEQIQ
ncbi:MAG: hypothetical protein ACFHVJ_17920 [Aestuariibacter sp.]